MREDSAATGSTSVPLSSATSGDLLKAALEKRNKAQNDIDTTKKLLDRLKGSTVKSKSAAIHERKLAQATIDFQAAEEEVRNLKMPAGIQESPKAVEMTNDELEPPGDTSGPATADSPASILTLRQSNLQSAPGLETITDLRQNLATVREDLDREKAEREQERKERDRQFAAVQETFTKFLATIESEKKERENRIQQELSHYKQQLRHDYQEAVQEIQTQARVDRDEDLSTHRELLGQIRTFQSDIGTLKVNNKSLQSENGTVKQDIASLQKSSRDDNRRLDSLEKDITKVYNKMDDFKDEIRGADANCIEKVLTATNDVINLKTRVNSDKKTMDQELTSIKETIGTLQKQNKESRDSKDTPPIQHDADALARLDALEAFQTSATECLNGVVGDLTQAKNDLDVMQDACSRVAYDAAREEAENVSKKMISRIEAIENKNASEEDLKAVSLRLTSRIDTIENKFVPDEDVKNRLSTCEAELAQVVKWVGQRAEDDPDLDTLTAKVSRLDYDLHGNQEEEEDGGVTSIVATCEESVRGLTLRFNDMVAELAKAKPGTEVLDKNSEKDRIAEEAINNKISNLESKIETQRSVFETQVRTSFNGLDHKVTGLEQQVNNACIELQSAKQGLNAQLPSLREDVQREKVARKDLENRMAAITQSSLGSTQVSLRAEIDTVRKTLLSTMETTNQLIIRNQQLNPEGIQKEFRVLSDRTRVLEAGLRNLEGRYNAITTTSMVQKMIDQIIGLLPPGKDFVSVIRDAGQHADQIRELRKEIKSLSDKVYLSNSTGIDDLGTLTQTMETCRRTVDAYGQRTEAMESQKQAILDKLSALQAQLGLDDGQLYGDINLRESMEISMRAAHESIEQINGRIAGESRAELQEKIQGIDSDLSLVKEQQGTLDERVKKLEEDVAKAATISPSDPTRLAKRQHLDELRHTVATQGSRINKLETNTREMSAAASNSNEDSDSASDDSPPSVPRRTPAAPLGPMMGTHHTKKLWQRQEVEKYGDPAISVVAVNRAGFGGRAVNARPGFMILSEAANRRNDIEKANVAPGTVEVVKSALSRFDNFGRTGAICSDHVDGRPPSEPVRKFRSQLSLMNPC
ncbi:hypothetical protein FKW77_004844 [Venturia effusa]|uniref:Uncharacterized protein n=1 Tax=Venturia effusa TaxID=50376 RepID=A0A517LMS4_9PEZI|nr:hypothetical protein FKW77_004844 [Venturia effusa]